MKNTKSILFFSCEPGGAEVLIPVIKLVKQETAHEVTVLGYGLGAERFARKKMDYIEIGSVERDDRTIMDSYRPDLIITSATSLPERDMSEKYLWHSARKAGIPTVAFLDQWQNYVVRFSGPSSNERQAYLPDYINCINDIGESEMVAQGFDAEILVKFGHPYLSSLESDAEHISVSEVRNRLGIFPDQRVVMFVSEAIREHYGNTRGYDQHDAFRLFLELMQKKSGAMEILVKLHPKDASEEYGEILNEYPHLRNRIIKSELSPLECVLIADEVYGMTSIMLIEAFILGKNVISLQPGLVGEDSCVLSRLGVIPLVLSRSTQGLAKPLSSIRNGFEYEFKNERFIEFFNSLLFPMGDPV